MENDTALPAQIMKGERHACRFPFQRDALTCKN